MVQRKITLLKLWKTQSVQFRKKNVMQIDRKIIYIYYDNLNSYVSHTKFLDLHTENTFC
jgi:hypothetical protein